ALEQPNLGFVRAGFEQFQKWTDPTGGWYEPFDTPPMQLTSDPVLRVGRAWIEAGLTVPDLPELKVGYEFRYRDGTKATTQWGSVGNANGDLVKAIHPATKAIDETVHAVKFDVRTPVLGVTLEDNFRGEFHDSTVRRARVDYFTLGNSVPDVVTRTTDNASHFRAVNTLRLEKSVRDWLFFSGGYLYSDLDGNAGFSLETFLPGDPSQSPFAGDFSNEIILNQRSHVLNANTLVGPWNGLTLSAGAQAEWMRQRGFGQATISGFSSPFSTDLDRLATDQTLAVRFTRLPATVLFGEARFQQEQFGQYEERSLADDFGDDRDFLRDTDARASLIDWRGGFTVSPWTRLSLTASYRHRDRNTDYDPLEDLDAGELPGNGYPAFILARGLTSDDVEARAVIRVNRWLKTTLKYQLVATDYDTTTTGAAAVIESGDTLAYGGATLQAGNYDAHVLSASATVTPWRRWYLSSTVAFAPSRMTTANTDGSLVAPYDGDVWSVIASSTYALSELLDLTATYSFSSADYGQDGLTAGLPLGIEYERHGLTAGLVRRLHRTVSASLQYGFYFYREPTAAGAADYTAHGIFASVTKVLP
ncbi:MAG: hypothetical protein ACYDC1_19915, partial [Limisphaerales bacterium]